MIGFIEKLDDWFRKAARNQLDDPEGAMHPPVAYTVSDTSALVQVDIPQITNWPWFGAGIVARRKHDLVEITAWRGLFEVDAASPFAPVLLLDFELPFEFPRTMRHLLLRLEQGGISSTKVLVHLMLAAIRLDPSEPMFVVLGTPSRGITGDQSKRQQHLQVWEIDAADVGMLRAASIACDVSTHFKELQTPDDIQGLIDSIFDDLFEWQRTSKVKWCSVLENRPEIVTRRDEGTKMDWFKGKSVALWGCGALGSLIAEHVVRAGVTNIALYDNKVIGAGVSVRQNFTDTDINEPKVTVLRERLLAISPTIDVAAHPVNLVTNTLGSEDWFEGVDVVIDTTASLRVRSKLEAVRKEQTKRVPIVSMMVSGAARHGAMAIVPSEFSGGSLDVYRRLSLAAMNRSWLKWAVQAFWDADSGETLRQPEPGCSDPTFVASHADMAALSARMLNEAAAELSEVTDEAVGALFSPDGDQRQFSVFRFRPDIVISGGSTEFRIAEGAWRDVRAWIRAGTRQRTAHYETGGGLFGQLDEALHIVWISNVCGPPRDSQFSSELFVCGIDGIRTLSDEYATSTRGVVQYIGTWHSHPVSAAEPSQTDYEGIASIFAENPTDGPQQVMMIVGYASRSSPEIGAYTIERHQYRRREFTAEFAMTACGSRVAAPALANLAAPMGLSLSGGGSRAVAFHLGTLRALEDLGLLQQIQTLSGVSGGALITGIVGYMHEAFAVVDQRIVSVLKRGLMRPAFIRLLHPRRAVQLLLSNMLVSLPNLAVGGIRFVLMKLLTVIPSLPSLRTAVSGLSWPLRRWYSRTHVLADAIESVVGPGRCNASTRDGKNIVFNACELRTGTAFRMSNEQLGSWRFGWGSAVEMRVADAIAASAAYPPALPAFDWSLLLEKHGVSKRYRVLITDGGVFENLGVSVMEPGRDPAVSAIGYSPRVIIASDAGVGQLSGEGLPSTWPARMVQTSSAVMRNVQDATKNRLHQHAADGRIDKFVYANLGQLDEKVPLKPSNWIDRDEVVGYPTNFSAMRIADIEQLSARGEAITRTLVTRYLLSD